MKPHFKCQETSQGTRRRLSLLTTLLLTSFGGSSAEAASGAATALAGSKFCDHAPMPTCKSYCELESLLLSKDKCSLCDVIASNAEKWNWQEHPEALCTGSPQDLEVECHAMAMCMETCPALQHGYCHIQTTPTTSEVSRPCPPVYLCEFCLSVLSSSALASDQLECFQHLHMPLHEL